MNGFQRRLAPAARTALVALLGLCSAAWAGAHCDTMDGPVVQAARLALEKRDVTPVLKWVKPAYEKAIRAAFARTLAVRGLGPEARDLADGWFFETLVRIHRAGEGAPFTGLLPSGTPIEPIIARADQALESGDIAPLLRAVAGRVEEELRSRFARAVEAKKRADESIAKGREFVAAYVELTHYAERLDANPTSAADPHAHGETRGQPGHEH